MSSEMKTYVFEGYSDDTFGEYNETNVDHDNCGSGAPIRFIVEHPSRKCGVIVTGQYQDTGCWSIAVHNLNEEENLVGWLFTMEPSYRGHRNRLVVVAPKFTQCLLLGQDDE